jgi:F0F1-type ATP synthase membrane subunit c/vacuolar-type H+-ATPase subunit K
VVLVTRRTTVIGLGTVLVLVGLVLIYNVGLASLAHSPAFREHNLTDPFTIEVSSRAVVTDDVELLRWNTMPDFVSPPDDVRVEGVAAGSGTLFMGIGPADAVAGYLDGVAHDEITEWDSAQDDIEYVVYTTNDGTADPAAPATEGFWVASVSGSGELALDWTIESGEWVLVIMNADGSPGVSADVRFGVATLSVLLPVGLASLVVGLAALISGGRLVTSLPSRPDESPRWTLRGRPVLPTTVEGRVAVLCSVLVFVPYTTGTVFGAPIFLFLGARKGDRGLLLVLPLLASIIVIGLIPIVVYQLVA